MHPTSLLVNLVVEAKLQSLPPTHAGGAGQQRLAARLITKFACHFPPDFERSVQVLTDLVKAYTAETVRSATASAILQDALKGLGTTVGDLCNLSPGHIALQQTTELLFRYDTIQNMTCVAFLVLSTE